MACVNEDVDLGSAWLNVIIQNYADEKAQTKVSAEINSTTEDAEEIEKALQDQLDQGLVAKDAEKKIRASRWSKECAEESDGELINICHQCRLPLGDFAYCEEHKKGMVHAECMAQLALRELKEQEDKHKTEAAATMKTHRAEYDIGWKIKNIPSNAAAANKLNLGFEPKGMCCLVLDDEGSVRVAPTFDSSAAVNLEYLSLALRCRVQEGREPIFSLDPIDGVPLSESTMHKVRFEPEWLAGTSAGEVMFQADYHLKELSMGACEQPVVGMKSCFDLSQDFDFNQEWNAREWFVVRKAEIQVSEDKVLIPYCKMGVEAREQTMGEDGLEDAKITRADHPLVKYAEQFTQNFDLIAERKSVVFHLRELAKATVMAKYLVDSGIKLDDSWLNLGESRIDQCLEVPRLWKERVHAKIVVEDGKVLDSENAFVPVWNNVFGGIAFGIEKFQLSASAAAPARMIAAPSRLGLSAVQLGAHTLGQQFEVQPPPAGSVVAVGTAAPRAPISAQAVAAAPVGAVVAGRPLAPTTMRLASVRGPAVAATSTLAFGAGRLATRPLDVEAKGVDLDLNRFDLSSAEQVTKEAAAASWGADLVIAKAFWQGIDGQSGTFAQDEKSLLQAIFQPSLSDRREEGDMFSPPDTSFSHVKKLRELTKKEEIVRRNRKEHFCSTDFVLGNAGMFFPASWSSLEISSAEDGLVQRKDYMAHSEAFEHVLTATTPLFDQTVEDGTRFRIYKVGSLEVRTIQEINAKETIGMIFSISTNREAGKSVSTSETVVKATLYVRANGKVGHRYFVVLETNRENTIVSETCGDTPTWEENPANLEDRISLAKFVRSAECGSQRIFHMKAYQERAVLGMKSSEHRSKWTKYPHRLFNMATRGDAALEREMTPAEEPASVKRSAPAHKPNADKPFGEKSLAGGFKSSMFKSRAK